MSRTQIQKLQLTPKEDFKLKQINPNHNPGDLIRTNPGSYILPSRLDLDYIKNDLKVYPDDVWIVTPPKVNIFEKVNIVNTVKYRIY